ncbi:hypothetical protein V491_08984, partial [Pseudogymnoascus sp. VKM F-3775]
MQFENTWPLAVCKSASVQRISAPVVDVTSPHNDAHGDDGTVRMAAPCPTNPAATIVVDGIKSRMAKISNGYPANSNEGTSPPTLPPDSVNIISTTTKPRENQRALASPVGHHTPFLMQGIIGATCPIAIPPRDWLGLKLGRLICVFDRWRGLGEWKMAAINFNGRTPWAIALTVLFLIWTVKLLQAPAVGHLQPVSPVASAGNEAPIVNPSIPKPPLPSEASNIQGGGAHIAAPNSEKEAAVEQSAKSKDAAAASTETTTPQPT